MTQDASLEPGAEALLLKAMSGDGEIAASDVDRAIFLSIAISLRKIAASQERAHEPR